MPRFPKTLGLFAPSCPVQGVDRASTLPIRSSGRIRVSFCPLKTTLISTQKELVPPYGQIDSSERPQNAL